MMHEKTSELAYIMEQVPMREVYRAKAHRSAFRLVQSGRVDTTHLTALGTGQMTPLKRLAIIWRTMRGSG